MNNVSLAGRLSRDPDIKYTQSGKPVCRFTLAVQRPFKNQQGAYEADFIDCEVWGHSAEFLANYTHKGDRVGAEGWIRKRNYEAKDGQKHYVTEVVCNHVESLQSRNAGQQPADNNFDNSHVDYNDNIPF